MKIKRIGFGIFCLLQWEVCSAQDLQNTTSINSQLKKIIQSSSLTGIYSYSNFKYDTSTTTMTNSYKGDSNLYLIGSNNLTISKDLYGSLFFYRSNSHVDFSQSTLAITKQKINGNTVMGYLLKQVKSSLYLTLLGGYGQNTLDYVTLATFNTASNPIGYAKGRSNNWFTNLKAFYNHTWGNVNLTANVGALYSQANQNAVNYYSVTSPLPIMLPSVNTKATFIMEGAELNYTKHSLIQPFVNGSLLQVAQYSTSNPALAVFSTPTQNFNLDQNGFEVGGGISLKYKKAVLRFEQQYIQRGNVYHNNLSIASITVAIG